MNKFMRKIVLVLFLILIGNNTFAQSKVFFENINIGDNLEKCIANGLVENTGGPNPRIAFEWGLTNSNVKSYFQYTGVGFDKNSIIKEIELLAFNLKSGNSGKDIDAKKTLNFMLRYFASQYSGMKQKNINTKNNISCTYDIGTEYTWETTSLTIHVKHYNRLHDEAICKTKPQGPLGDFCADSFMNCGTYTKVNIIKK